MKLNKRYINLLLFLFAGLFIISSSIFRPYQNWDIVMYIAAAKSFEEQDPKALKEFSYQQLEQTVTPATFEGLTQRDGYINTVFTDLSSFTEQLPFYQIRPVYTGLIFLLYKAGMNIVFTTYIISGISVLFAFLLIYKISFKYISDEFIWLVPVLALIFNIPDLARYSSPDALGFLSIILSTYLFIKKRYGLLLILCPLFIGIRNDLLMFTFPLMLAIYLLNKKYMLKIIISLSASLAIYYIIGNYWGHPGWATVFRFTLVQITSHPVSEPITLSVGQYFYALMKGVLEFPDNPHFTLYILISSIVLYFLISKRNKTKSFYESIKSPEYLLVFVSFTYIGLHFISFPAAWLRFFSGVYVTGFISLLIMLSDYLKKKNIQK